MGSTISADLMLHNIIVGNKLHESTPIFLHVSDNKPSTETTHVPLLCLGGEREMEQSSNSSSSVSELHINSLTERLEENFIRAAQISARSFVLGIRDRALNRGK